MSRWIAVLIVLLFSGVALATPSKLVRRARGVPHEYIVVLPDDTPSAAVAGLARSIAASYGLELDTVWEYSLRGFLVRGNVENVEALAADPRVAFVEQDFVTDAPRLSATQWTVFNETDPANHCDQAGECEYLWHLDRVDETSGAGLDNQHNMCTEGREAVAYVIDTGVQRDHPQFESPSRVVEALDFSNDRADLGSVYGNDRTNGCTAANFVNRSRWHGTAVASVLAGTQVGVAKVQVVSLKVFQCASGSRRADFIDAVNWIGSPNNIHRYKPGVINHSGAIAQWGDHVDPIGNDFDAYSTAVKNLVNATGIPFFTSADNYSAPACQFSPNNLARTNTRPGTVFVVGGTSIGADTNDYRWQNMTNGIPNIGQDSGANGGECVSIYAPAHNFYAARHSAFLENGDSRLYGRANGTSFSSPLVAGIAARYMQRQWQATGTKPLAQDVYTWLLGNAKGTVLNTTTPEYWYCAPDSGTGAAYRSNPPANCASSQWGQTGPGTAPYYFPPVGNSSSARNVYFDEGYCP